MFEFRFYTKLTDPTGSDGETKINMSGNAGFSILSYVDGLALPNLDHYRGAMTIHITTFGVTAFRIRAYLRHLA
jgi:hypothetical protein